ncbi:hypothetical protein F511_17647 [Dorcoceras hygrometricum]|uniref:Uncharacterized protein n=1 Tax=Dorcoceras hygrometricum TaxID=472368 RepID=A0A2Z7AQY7_9LAMI|nr:hypothetical protein F511_17647 [Dorcoceras hygrometricum]
MLSNPSTESNIKQQWKATDNMQMLCVRTRLKPKHREPKNLKELLIDKYGSTEQQYNSGHGVCEYMRATHSSQHTAPDAKHSSTRCCPTHEMWMLPTSLIVSNRSQQGDEVRELPAQPLTASWILTHTQRATQRQAKSDAYANRLHKGDVFAHLSSFTQASKSSTKRSVLARGVQRYHSYFNRSCLSSAIGEDKISSKSEDQRLKSVSRSLTKTLSFQLIQTTWFSYSLQKHAGSHPTPAKPDSNTTAERDYSGWLTLTARQIPLKI